MGWIIFVKSTFKIASFFEYVQAVSMFLEVYKGTLILISVRILNDSFTDNLILKPNSFYFTSLLRKAAGNVLSITNFFTMLPMSEKVIICYFYNLTDPMFFSFLPLSNIQLSTFHEIFTNPTHLFAICKLAKIIDLCSN